MNPALQAGPEPATVKVAAAMGAWASLLDGLPQPAWLVDLADRSVVAVNVAATVFLGQPQSALLGQAAASLLASPEDLAWWQAAAAGHTEPLLSDTVVTTGQGRSVNVTRSIQAVKSEAGAAPAGRFSHALVSVVDRSAARRADDEREALLAELQATLEATADGILVTDAEGRVRAFNRRFAQLWALPAQVLLQQDGVAVEAWMRRSLCDAQAHDRALHLLAQGGTDSSPDGASCGAPDSAPDRLELHSGRVLERVSKPLLRNGLAQGRVWSFRDLTAKLAAQTQIRTLQRCDALTGLPNRNTLAEQFQQLQQGQPSQLRTVPQAAKGQGLALLVVGLDRFRPLNETLGLAAGDRVLQEVAQRLRRCVRDDDVLARLQGDQFALLVRSRDGAALASTARRILKAVAEPFEHQGHSFTLTCSVGMALAVAPGTDLEELVRDAEAAMRAVKAAGRAGYRMHQQRAEPVQGDPRWRMKLDHAMRQALASRRFRLMYQPQINLRDGRVIGAEALLRWRDPELGELAPGQFIPVAEETGFIVALGDWVLAQAVRQAVHWQQRGTPMPIAVNVSALQFQQPHFVQRLAQLLAASALPPQLLELELTESILVQDADEALLRLAALRKLGLRLAIDDFGTGYSSLSYLKRFPIGKLKIDRSFVKGLPTDTRDAGIVRAILQMARALNMKVVAEGVETQAQRHFLREAGCDECQGFLFAPALDAMSLQAHAFGAASAASAASAATADTAPNQAPRTAPRLQLVVD